MRTFRSITEIFTFLKFVFFKPYLLNNSSPDNTDFLIFLVDVFCLFCDFLMEKYLYQTELDSEIIHFEIFKINYSI